MSTFEKPVRWDDWDLEAQVSYLELSKTRADLMTMFREEIDSSRDSGRFNKSELAHVCLLSGVVQCD